MQQWHRVSRHTCCPSHDEDDLDWASYEGRDSGVLLRLLNDVSDASSEEHLALPMLCSMPLPERGLSPGTALGCNRVTAVRPMIAIILRKILLGLFI